MRPHELATIILTQTSPIGKPLSLDSALTPRHHQLVYQAYNCVPSPADMLEMHRIHAALAAGTYQQEQALYHGIEHLTNVNGFLCWKDVPVQSQLATGEAAVDEAVHLGQRCRQLENIGIPVNARTVAQAECFTAPASTPWKKALASYCFFVSQGENVTAVFHRERQAPGEAKAVAVSTDEHGHLMLKFFPTADAAYQQYRYEGHILSDTDLASPYAAADALASTGLEPAELDRVLAM